MRSALILILVALIAYQVYATARVLSAREYSRAQKLVQSIIIWAIPALGALFCHIFLMMDRAGARPRDNRLVPDAGYGPEGPGDHGHH
ncbi:MAG TPA: hypothetical protein VF522_00540 [Ramlibacter sp.]|uniref:hypothetical protein n=1 Tax=Ramlibacter sp. TaxID=1917967 RepID=UPI002ED66802